MKRPDEAIANLRQLQSWCEDELLERLIQRAMYDEECEERGVDWVMENMIAALELALAADCKEEFGAICQRHRFDTQAAYRRLTRSSQNFGYVYKLLLDFGALPKIAKIDPNHWPYPYMALGALVLDPRQLGVDGPNAWGDPLLQLAGFVICAKKGGEKTREQVREFVRGFIGYTDSETILKAIFPH